MDAGKGPRQVRELDMLAVTAAEAGAAAAGRQDRPEVPRGEQMGSGPQEPVQARAAGAEPQGYVRLRMHVEDGETTVRDVGRVAGPLTVTDEVGGAFAWEVTLDGERLSGDALGDLATWRSFPSPDPKAPEKHRGHHITKAREFDFTVRIPEGKLPADALERVEVALLRVTDSSRSLVATRRALTDQYPVEVRTVGRLSGPPLAEGLRRALAAPAAPAVLPQQ